ncbi:uncharacterized protein EV422DRAFT_618098 [Fimicolochytrium jonesii]|uniref:uncharacterized protein n=1 Tax=Fimicolochytrium jonesii TaxID=1396493 RepID=UPI0022FF3D75|nr:uncharacterized protein EV422DRAFT_618098 [Fimicolochytrium jonesii]KAI8824432.1 hypothetical protein EV422DRAFT_618098 [Fimicolochytrium jonesii]
MAGASPLKTGNGAQRKRGRPLKAPIDDDSVVISDSSDSDTSPRPAKKLSQPLPTRRKLAPTSTTRSKSTTNVDDFFDMGKKGSVGTIRATMNVQRRQPVRRNGSGSSNESATTAGSQMGIGEAVLGSLGARGEFGRVGSFGPDKVAALDYALSDSEDEEERLVFMVVSWCGRTCGPMTLTSLDLFSGRQAKRGKKPVEKTPPVEREPSLSPPPSPPPEVPEDVIMSLYVRSQELKRTCNELRAPEILEYESTSLSTLDPALMDLANPFTSSSSSSDFQDSRPITIRVERKRYPAVPDAEFIKPLKLRLRRDQPFDHLMAAVCNQWSLDRQRTVFLCRNAALFKYGTPAALDMDDDSVLDVYNKPEYDAFRLASNAPSPPRTHADFSTGPSSHCGGASSSAQAPGPTHAPIEPTDPLVAIKITHNTTAPLKLKAKLSATVDEVIDAFVKARHGPPAGTSFRMMFEGEMLGGGATLEGLGLEDEDVVEIHAR